MDLIDRAEVIQAFQPKNGIADFKYIFTSDTAKCIVRNLPKVDAVPMSVITEIKAEIEQQAIPYEIDGRGNGKSIRFGLGMALEIIDRKVKERET